MTDIEIERVYGRCRRKHAASDYATHLQANLYFLHIYSIQYHFVQSCCERLVLH
jgi:hypothetical protein